MAGSEAILEDAKKSGKTNIKLVKFEKVGPEGNGHIGISKHEDFDQCVNNAVLEAHEYSKSSNSADSNSAVSL